MRSVARSKGIQISGLFLILALAHAPLSRAQIDLTGAVHASLSDLGPGLGAALDLFFAFAWAPIPEVALGLETGLGLPLPTGEDTTTTDLTYRANPAVWLRFGNPEVWTYLKAGCGLDSHVRDGDFTPVLVVVGALGFAVAPRTLLFYFGFELTGQYEVAGELPTRMVGLGGFLGYRF
jgi:hypothetical protein